MRCKFLITLIMAAFLFLCIGSTPAFSKINILYKNSLGTSDEYFSLNSGDVLIAGSKIRIRLSNLKTGEYALVLKDPANNEAVLAQ